MKNEFIEKSLFDTANYIIEKCQNVTNMKLQKLVYYSQAHFLVQNNGISLFETDIEAWVYGPVVRTL